MQLKELYHHTITGLSGIDNAEFEAFWMVKQVCGIEKSDLFLRPETEISLQKSEKIAQMVGERLSGRPLYYILGECEFFGLPFLVGDGVLIPRQDTECLVEEALEILKDLPNPTVLDLCAGSGAVSVSLAKTRPDSLVTAVEYSAAAFAYLIKNAEKNETENLVLVKADVKTYLPDKTYDLIVSNPPYIPKNDLHTLQKEVKFEPEMALDGGEDGLDFYRLILERYTPFVKRGMVFEIGIGQDEAVKELFLRYDYKTVYDVCDLCGVKRVIAGRKD